MFRRFAQRRCIYPLLVLGAVALGAYWLRAQDAVRWSYQVPGDSKPISLDADDVSTWIEGTQRVLILKGMVLAEHGVVRIRSQQAVVWIDQESKRRSGIYQIQVFAEGDVHYDQGAEGHSSDRAVITLSTRGEVKIKSHAGKVVQQPQPGDPLYLRARAEIGLPPPAQQPLIQRTSFQQEVGAVGIPVQAAPIPGPVGPPPTNPAPQQAAPAPGPAAPAPPNPVPVPAPALPPSAQPLPPSSAPPPVPAQPAPPGATPVPRPAGGPGPPAPSGQQAATAPGILRQFNVAPRSSTGLNVDPHLLPNGEQALVITSGVILTIRSVGGKAGLLDIEADRLVIWYRGENGKQLLGGLSSPEGQTNQEIKEIYLAGNVEIREISGKDTRVLRADEVYFDVGRDVALALRADLEFRQPGQPEPVHMSAEEMQRLSPTLHKAVRAEIFSSTLPSDPGLKVYVSNGTLEDKKVPRSAFITWLFGTGSLGPPPVEEQLFTGRNVFLELGNVPIFYFPYIQGDANDPLGPVQNLAFNYDSIFGFQAKFSWNLYDLLGLNPIPGTHWRLYTDYLQKRGPALGTDFDYTTKEMVGIPGFYTGQVKLYGIEDNGTDVLGGPRGPDDNHPVDRGRFLWRQNAMELPDGFTVQTQVSLLSDKNFLEQYYKMEFDNDINQETFLYVKQQQGNMAWTVLGEPNVRDWVTETEWLPRADGYVIGQSFFDLLTYNVHASAGYAQLLPTQVPPPPEDLTTKRDNTGRFDLMQELSLPFTLGPVRLVPYGLLDLTEYTQDLNGNEVGRVYGGGGLRASMPLTRLYPDVQSELFNLNGINHKIVLSGNYFIAGTNVPFSQLPQLDRLNDDATDQSIRDINPLQPVYNPGHGLFLATSPLFDPQTYAIRRLVDTNVDTLDNIEELQMDVRQRWQTKRGYPGMEHIVDWMTLDLSATYFPNPARDNFNEPFAFLQYDWIWNIGDRTALTSSAWYDPIDQGARVFTFGAYLNRPDRTNFFLGYREIYPLNSDLVSASVTYVFSPKYAITASTAYDFGTKQSQSNSFILTRTGTDLQASLGINYNAITNNFGVTFEVIPNIVPANKRGGLSGLGSGLLTQR